MTHSERVALYLREGRTVSGGKGSQTDQTAAHTSLDFQSTLINSFKAQFGAQSGIMSFLTTGLEKSISNPQGFDPATLTSLRTNATTDNALNVLHAQQAAAVSAAGHEGTGLPSGVQAQVAGQIASAGANDLSDNQGKINIANGELQQQNYWKSVGALTGVGELENPMGYASGAAGQAGSIAGLSEASTQADQSGFLGQFSNSFGKTLGSTLGGGNAGQGTSGGASGWVGM